MEETVIFRNEDTYGKHDCHHWKQRSDEDEHFKVTWLNLKNFINPFHANVRFLHPISTTKSFLMFSVGIEIGHWHENG